MGFVLLIPFLLVRFGLLALLDKDAVERAARFAPLAGNERIAYGVYQLSNAAIFVYSFFLSIELQPSAVFAIGAAVYAAGAVLLVAAVASFAAPGEDGLNRTGLYRFSRNPMYVAYFVYFVGCALLTQSTALFVLVVVFQLSAHWIVRSEERWCIERFGDEYLLYAKRVRRYL